MQLKINSNVTKITLAAMLLALAWVLPFLTGQIPEIGRMLLPMHIPAFLAGLLLGPKYGLMLGFLMPITRSLIFTMPPIYPTATAMAFELAAYGFFSGLLFYYLNQYKLRFIVNVYISLLVAMLAGRIVWGLVYSMLGLFGNLFTFQMFITGALIIAWPGMIVQCIIIPIVMQTLKHAELLDALPE